jgi:hypothetical protein
VLLFTTTAYSGRLEDVVAEDFGFVDVSAFEEVPVFDFVFRADLVCLRSAGCSSSPPDEAKESCGLKY